MIFFPRWSKIQRFVEGSETKYYMHVNYFGDEEKKENFVIKITKNKHYNEHGHGQKNTVKNMDMDMEEVVD